MSATPPNKAFQTDTERRLFVTVLIPFGIGYFLSYFFRTVNVVIASDLAIDLQLTAADLGFLTSIYFILFAAFQTPLGVILDRYGPRRVQIILLIIAALGSFLFAISNSIIALIIARSLIGLGVSGCLMAALKANAQWFPINRLPFVNACTMTFGTFGALTATIPVELMADFYGWRMIFLILSGFTIFLVLLTILVIPDQKYSVNGKDKINYNFSDQFRDLMAIYRDRFFWQIAVITLIHGGVFLSYQALWMGPWLADVAGQTKSEVANSMLVFNIGMLVGVISMGVIADKLQHLGIGLISVVRAGVMLSLIFQIMIAAEFTSLSIYLCAGFGFFGSSTLLVYALLSQTFPSHMVGKVNTAQNMLIFISAFILQWGIGVLIGLWPPLGDGSYDPVGHQVALISVILLEILGFILLLLPVRRSSVI